MDSMGFDGFDSLSTDSFDSSGGFDSLNFDDVPLNDSFDMQSNNTDASDSNTGDNQFQGAFDSDNTEFPDTNDGGLKKQAIIAGIAGIIILLLVIFIAGKVNGFINNKETVDNSIQYQQDNTVDSANNANQYNANQNVDNIMQDNHYTAPVQQSSSTIITNTKDDNFTWSEITANENVTFNNDYVDMTFTVTDIQHRARVVDTNNNLVVETKLLGSISGLSGTYELNVPYNKGIKLVVGNSFTVHVQLGSFNDKTVVGEILY